MRINVKLLRRVKRHILAEPKRLSMAIWVEKRSKSEGGPECGTIGCIAGWAVLLSTPKKKWATVIEKQCMAMEPEGPTPDKARKLLNLTDGEAYELFNAESGITAKAFTKLHAQQTARRIDQFIEAHK